MTTRVTEGARRGRLHFSRLEAWLLDTLVPMHPLTKSVEKERLLARSLCLYSYIKCSCRVVKKISDKLAIAAVPLKLEQVGPIFSSFNPSPSLSSAATDDRKQFQCINIILNNKTGPLFLVLY